MRIVKDPFTGKLLVSLDEFERKQYKEKNVFDMTYTKMKVFFDDIHEIVMGEVSILEKEYERKRNEELFNK
jgi:hypothetical protein